MTENVAWPLALVVPDSVVTLDVGLLANRVTVRPATGVAGALLIVTVMVEAVLLSPATEVGLAATVEKAEPAAGTVTVLLTWVAAK